jgi:type IX secretion system PorP/SprF family membrane protein
MGSLSYDILNNKKQSKAVVANLYKKHVLTVGLQMGLFYRTTNPNALNYDVQYTYADGGTFDQRIPNNEVYNSVSIVRFDANYGIYYKFLDTRKKYHPYAGLSLSHFTRPKESLTGADSRMPLKWSMQGGCDLLLNDKIEITPRALYLLQSKASDLSAGVLMTYLLNEDETRLLAAFDYRVNDAVIFSLGLKTYKYAIRLSYDFNTSYLKKYTRGRGGLELSLVYNGRKKRSTRMKIERSIQNL